MARQTTITVIRDWVAGHLGHDYHVAVKPPKGADLRPLKGLGYEYEKNQFAGYDSRYELTDCLRKLASDFHIMNIRDWPSDGPKKSRAGGPELEIHLFKEVGQEFYFAANTDYDAIDLKRYDFSWETDYWKSYSSLDKLRHDLEAIQEHYDVKGLDDLLDSTGAKYREYKGSNSEGPKERKGRSQPHPKITSSRLTSIKFRPDLNDLVFKIELLSDEPITSIPKAKIALSLQGRDPRYLRGQFVSPTSMKVAGGVVEVTLHLSSNDFVLCSQNRSLELYIAIFDYNKRFEFNVPENPAQKAYQAQKQQYQGFNADDFHDHFFGGKRGSRSSPPPRPQFDPWTVMGLKPGAPWDEIKKTYRALILKHHPDKGGDIEMAKKVNEAYDYLKKQYGSTASVTSVEAMAEMGLRSLWRVQVARKYRV